MMIVHTEDGNIKTTTNTKRNVLPQAYFISSELEHVARIHYDKYLIT